VVAGRVVVARDDNEVVLGPPDGCGHRAGVERLPDRHGARPADDEASGEDARVGASLCGLGGCHHEALLRRRRQAALGGTDDAPDEDVEEDDEGGLERDEDRLDGHVPSGTP
jgi:hypothetical protein